MIKCVLVLAVVFVLSNQVNCEKEQDVEALLNSESNGALLLKHVVKAYSRVLAENAKLRRENSELVEFISEGWIFSIYLIFLFMSI